MIVWEIDSNDWTSKTIYRLWGDGAYYLIRIFPEGSYCPCFCITTEFPLGEDYRNDL